MLHSNVTARILRSNMMRISLAVTHIWIIILPIQLTYGKYQLIEVKAGTGYVLDKNPIDFTVDGTKTVFTIEKYNKAEKGTITITKFGDIFKTVTEETVTAPTEETDPTTEPEATQSDDAKVTEPTEPSKPAEPTRPAEPTAPNGDPFNPSAPQEPTKPQKPTEPTKTIFEDEATAPTEEVSPISL